MTAPHIAAAPPRPATDGPPPDTSRAERALAPLVAGLVVVGIPVAGITLAVTVVGLPTWYEALVAVVLYVATGLGVTAGFHRLFTHRSYTASRPLSVCLAVAGSMALEGSLSGWVANHRVHHRFSDAVGDPHSPWVSDDGSRPVSRWWARYWHAQAGWLFSPTGADPEVLCRDLLDDRALASVSRWWAPLAVGGMVVPALVAGALGGWSALLGMLVWAGLLRVALLHHVTWAVNSWCHTFGRQPFDSGDDSRDVAALAVLSFGESWHNGHHAFPRSSRHALSGRRQWDPTASFISLACRLRLASDPRLPTADQLERRRH